MLRGKFCAALLSAFLLCASLAVAQDGKTLFDSKCKMCHGADGAAATPMGKNLHIRDLRSADVQKQSDAELMQIITKGKGKMPAFGDKLTKEQITSVVKYIRELGKQK